MNILVTGSKGQLGNEFQKIAATDQQHLWFFTDINELDITDKAHVSGFFRVHEIEVCINCAAYTAVDKAEEESDLANKINAEAVEILADACYQNQALLIHISTDYVFNGENFKPYVEDDNIQAVSAYGKSKARGEELIYKHAVNSIIFRTSWLYSAYGNNFVKTMLRLGKERSELSVVADQVGTPTWSFDLATAIMLAIDRYEGQTFKQIFHFSNEGAISWFDFACEIMQLNNLSCRIKPIESKDYPVKTSRPFYSVLNKSKLKQYYQIEIPYWKSSLIKCLEELNGTKSPK